MTDIAERFRVISDEIEQRSRDVTDRRSQNRDKATGFLRRAVHPALDEIARGYNRSHSTSGKLEVRPHHPIELGVHEDSVEIGFFVGSRDAARFSFEIETKSSEAGVFATCRSSVVAKAQDVSKYVDDPDPQARVEDLFFDHWRRYLARERNLPLSELGIEGAAD